MELAHYIDHTLLKPTATIADISKLCLEAITYNFFAVCINSCYLPLAKKELEGSHVKLASVVGFPLGAMSAESKISEAHYCIENGADEIDMVLNIGGLKSGAYDIVRDEILKIKETVGNKTLKVIIETCYLTHKEKQMACTLAVEAKADFVKTSTGFGTGGATFDDVKLMKDIVGNKARIKASGGIKDRKTALRYIDLGVSRIGTSSGISLVLS